MRPMRGRGVASFLALALAGSAAAAAGTDIPSEVLELQAGTPDFQEEVSSMRASGLTWIQVRRELLMERGVGSYGFADTVPRPAPRPLGPLHARQVSLLADPATIGPLSVPELPGLTRRPGAASQVTMRIGGTHGRYRRRVAPPRRDAGLGAQAAPPSSRLARQPVGR